MSGHEKDEGRDTVRPPDISLAQENHMEDVDIPEEVGRTVFLHPRFDPARSFMQHHAALSRALKDHPYPGIVAAVADQDRLDLTWISASDDQIRAAIIGRHSRATLALPQDHTTAALRHLVLLVRAEKSKPIARLLDLQTESGFADPLGRRFEAVRTDGATFLSVAGTVLMLLPTGPDRLLHSDPATAWKAIPPRRWLETRSGRPQTPVPIDTSVETTIETQNGPKGCRNQLCREPEIPVGILTIASGGDETHVRVAGRALDEGFLIGRYDRCEVGGPEADESLSRVHLLVVREGRHAIAVDTASTNGTFIGEQRVHLMELKERTQLDLGGVLDLTWRASN